MNETATLIDTLVDVAEYEYDFKYADCLRVFGPVAGKHLWLRFTEGCGSSLLHFFTRLSANNRTLLVNDIITYMEGKQDELH